MPASIATAHALLDHLLRGEAYATPGRVYLSLHTADPAGTGLNEVSTDDWPSYSRRDPADGGPVSGGFDAPDGKATVNTNTISFPPMNGTEQVTITHFGIWDAETNGNFLIAGQLTLDAVPSPRTLFPSDEMLARPGTFTVEID